MCQTRRYFFDHGKRNLFLLPNPKSNHLSLSFRIEISNVLSIVFVVSYPPIITFNFHRMHQMEIFLSLVVYSISYSVQFMINIFVFISIFSLMNNNQFEYLYQIYIENLKSHKQPFNFLI